MSGNVVPLNGEILPGSQHQQPAPKPKSLEDQVADDLGQEDAQRAIAICERLATEPKGVGEIAAAVLDLGDDQNAAKCRFYRLKVRSAALATMYARAKEARADLIVDEIIEIADAPLPVGDAAKLKAEVESRKLKVDARKWAAGKYNRLLYSDEPKQPGVQVTINNDNGASALDEIRQRLARKRQNMIGHERPKQIEASAGCNEDADGMSSAGHTPTS